MIEDNYEDIINLPHYEPKYHPRMSKHNRAAQFAPFAALTGYEEQVKETARLTEKKIEIDDGLKEILGNILIYIQENLNIKSYIPKDVSVTILPPQPKKKKKKLFAFLDEEVN